MATPTVRRMLVPTDFSDGAASGLEWAQMLARAFSAEIVLLHVVDLGATWVPLSGPAVFPTPAPAGAVAQVADLAKGALDALGQDAPEVAQRLVRTGHPREQIPEIAREVGADMIVMGSHGRRGMSHLVIGSVAEYVVRHATVPVLIIRSTAPET